MDSDKSSEETRSSRERDNRDIERGKRIRALRDETGMTQTGFAQLVGVNRPSTISDWENGWSEPQRSQMKRLADAFDVPFRSMEAYIRWGQPLRARGVGHNIGPDATLPTLPMVAKVPAAWGAERMPAVHIESDQLDRGDIIDRDAFALQVDGDSMEPDLLHGSIVLCSPAARINNGDIVVVQFGPDRDDENCIRYVYAHGDDAVLLVPANKNYPPQTVQRESIVNMCRVIEVRRKV